VQNPDSVIVIYLSVSGLLIILQKYKKLFRFIIALPADFQYILSNRLAISAFLLLNGISF